MWDNMFMCDVWCRWLEVTQEVDEGVQKSRLMAGKILGEYNPARTSGF
jgi:hypothetical protein